MAFKSKQLEWNTTFAYIIVQIVNCYYVYNLERILAKKARSRILHIVNIDLETVDIFHVATRVCYDPGFSRGRLGNWHYVSVSAGSDYFPLADTLVNKHATTAVKLYNCLHN